MARQIQDKEKILLYLLYYERILNEKTLENIIRWSKKDAEFIEKEKEEYERERKNAPIKKDCDYRIDLLRNSI